MPLFHQFPPNSSKAPSPLISLRLGPLSPYSPNNPCPLWLEESLANVWARRLIIIVSELIPGVHNMVTDLERKYSV